MQRLRLFLMAFVLAAVAVTSHVFVGEISAKEPVKIIFDTDLGNDIDDVMALAVAHALQNRGEIEILAVTTTKDNRWVAPAISVLNTFYGRPSIPIGVTNNHVTEDDGKYLAGVANARNEFGQYQWPKNVGAGDQLPDAVALIRQILARQEDQSVVFVQIGFFSNLARLLDTPADAISPLTGKELVVKKIKYVSMMAGAFGKNANELKEYNVVNDLAASKKVVSKWPTDIVFSGFEIGMLIDYPSESISNDFEYVAAHPVKEGYRLYRGLENRQPTFDLNSVLYAARPDRGYYTLSKPGTVSFSDEGVTKFEPTPNGKHRFQSVDEKQIITVREALVQLTSEPPRTSFEK